jgi:hypothetical protein
LLTVMPSHPETPKSKSNYHIEFAQNARMHSGCWRGPHSSLIRAKAEKGGDWFFGPYAVGPRQRYLLRDRDSIFGRDFVQPVKAMGIQQMLSPPRSPWQRAYAERVIGTFRRECLDHVIVFNQASLYRHLIVRDVLSRIPDAPLAREGLAAVVAELRVGYLGEVAPAIANNPGVIHYLTGRSESAVECFRQSLTTQCGGLAKIARTLRNLVLGSGTPRGVSGLSNSL